MSGRLVVLSGNGEASAPHAFDLASALVRGDLVVLNDSATLPASLPARAGDRHVEIRLARRLSSDAREWTAVLFGQGDFHTRTENRPPPPRLAVGDRLTIGPKLAATIARVDPGGRGRLVDLLFDAAPDQLWPALYHYGRPVQYAHTSSAYALWDVQNVYAGPPWSVEPPSAGHVLTAASLAALRERGVVLATLTHAAGLSSTGDPTLDARFPLPERYSIPTSTAAAIANARARGGRVIAIGTTTMRALEHAAVRGRGAVRPGAGEADLLITRHHRRRVVDALLTGLHDETTSHFRVLESFVSAKVARAAVADAFARGLAGHERGDAMLIFGAHQIGTHHAASASHTSGSTS